MNQIDADRLDERAERYSTQADYCRREAEGPLDPWALLAAAWTELAETYSTQADHCRSEAEGTLDPWALLAAAWTKLAEETEARSRGSRPS